MDPSKLTPEQRAQLEEKLKNMSPEEIQEMQKQQCIFCQIVAGKIPSKEIYKDEHCIAVLDVNPAAKGHLLIIPKEHYGIMPQVPAQITTHLFIVARSLSKMLLQTLKVSGTNLFIANGPAAGQRVSHLVIHLIPRAEKSELFTLKEETLDQQSLQKIKAAVGQKLNQLLGLEKPQEQHQVEEEKEPQAQEKAQPTQQQEEPAKKEEEVSLDDIANLF